MIGYMVAHAVRIFSLLRAAWTGASVGNGVQEEIMRVSGARE